MDRQEKLLIKISSDIKWMREKQKDHDRLLDKIENILAEGTGKIHSNKLKLNGLISILCSIGALIAGLFGFLFVKVLDISKELAGK